MNKRSKTALKIIVSIINVACMVITLFSPCSTTAFSVIPIIITSSFWLFDVENTLVRDMLIFVGTTVAGFCIFIGETCRIPSFCDTNGTKISNCGETIIAFKRETIYLGNGNYDFEYYYFMIIIIATVILISLSDIVSEYLYLKKKDRSTNRNINLITKNIIKKHL